MVTWLRKINRDTLLFQQHGDLPRIDIIVVLRGPKLYCDIARTDIAEIHCFLINQTFAARNVS